MTVRLIRLGMLLALGLAVHLVESAVALPVLLPGARLGLANVATLVVLAEFGPGAAALFGPVRHVIGSAASGTLLVPTFWLGMGGSIAASVVLLLAGRRLSLRTAGVMAGAAFQIGQGAALIGLAGSVAFAGYVPPLLALGVGAGWMTGELAERIVRILRPGRPVRRDLSLPVAGLLLLAALALPFLVLPGSAGAEARRAAVFVAGKRVMTIALTQHETWPLEVAGGQMLIESAPGRVRVLQSDCPDRVCVRTGWISTPGRSILCAPYRVLIILEGGAPDVDGVVY